MQQALLSRFPNSGLCVRELLPHEKATGFMAHVTFYADVDSKQAVYRVGHTTDPDSAGTERDAIIGLLDMLGDKDLFSEIARLYTAKIPAQEHNCHSNAYGRCIFCDRLMTNDPNANQPA